MSCEYVHNTLCLEPATPSEAGMSVEESLIEAARNGNGKAFGNLVEAHIPMLFRVAMRVSRDPQMAEDAVQETLTIAFKQLHKYTPNTSFRAFLATIATRRTQTLIRSERRRKKRERLGLSIGGPAPTPLQLTEAEQIAEDLRVAISQMPKKRRAVILLRIEGGLSYAEIARELGGTEDSIRVLAHLALKNLKSRLEQR